MPCFWISVPHSTVPRATTAPTERSMPPVRITNVIPTATGNRNELSMKMLRITWASPKPGKRSAPIVNITMNSTSVVSTATYFWGSLKELPRRIAAVVMRAPRRADRPWDGQAPGRVPDASW